MKSEMGLKNIHYFKMVESTMEIADKFANQNCPDYTAIVAEKQTIGCGRMGRKWHSAIGGLYFSVVLNFRIPIDFSAYVGITTAVVIANVLKDILDVKVKLKWPNDIIFNGYKVCGILSRTKIDENKTSYFNIGVGMNTNNKPNVFFPRAISLFEITGQKISHTKVLLTFLDYLKSEFTNFNIKNVLKVWKELNTTIGNPVKIVTLEKQIEGTAVGVDSKGNLRVLMDAGFVETVSYGDCFHI